MTMQDIVSKIEQTYEDGDLYLIEVLSRDSGFFVLDKKIIFVERDMDNFQMESIDTEYLQLQTHVKVRGVKNNQSFEEDYYNLIMYKNSDEKNMTSFVKLCRIYCKNEENVSFKSFFYSLISLFQLPTEQSFKNVLGLFGELKLMQTVWEDYRVDLSKCWHKAGVNSKYDFSNGNECIEVKTTSLGKKGITIKHEQIFGGAECFLATVICEKSEVGESVEEVVNRLFKYESAFANLNFSINIEKELKRISPNDYSEKKFVLNNIMLFNAKEINPFSEVPDNINGLSYDLELDEQKSLNDDEKSDVIGKFSISR